MKETVMAHINRNFTLRDTARMLRKNMTRHEKHLWYDYLKQYPVRWYKQRIIENFIVDFYCSNAKLVVELDGSQHYTEQGLEYDRERSLYLEAYGLMVLRFSNDDIDKNFEGVCMEIDRVVKERMKNSDFADSIITDNSLLR
jgi:very-short-patch-repair endonuclease